MTELNRIKIDNNKALDAITSKELSPSELLQPFWDHMKE